MSALDSITHGLSQLSLIEDKKLAQFASDSNTFYITFHNLPMIFADWDMVGNILQQGKAKMIIPRESYRMLASGSRQKTISEFVRRHEDKIYNCPYFLNGGYKNQPEQDLNFLAGTVKNIFCIVLEKDKNEPRFISRYQLQETYDKWCASKIAPLPKDTHFSFEELV